MGRSEDEATLHDALVLTVAGDDPGALGRVFFADKKALCTKRHFFLENVGETRRSVGSCLGRSTVPMSCAGR